MPAYSISFGAADALLKADNLTVPVTVVLYPGAGCSVKAQWSATPDAYENPNAARWNDWNAGAVSVTTWDRLESPVTAFRFQRTAGSLASVAEVASA